MQITGFRTSTFWKGELGVNADVKDGEQLYTVRLFIKGSQIRDYSCSCVEGNSFRGMCPHASLAWEEWKRRQENQAGRLVYTSQEIRTMIREYTNREVADIIRQQEENQMRLVPRLLLRQDGVSVEFRVGKERLCLIKDLTAFVQALESGASVAYGKNPAFHHSVYAFLEEDRPLCRLLMELVHVYQEHYEQFKKSAFATVQGLRELNLSSANRGRFFRLMDGKSLEIEKADGTRCTVLVRTEQEIAVPGQKGLPGFRLTVAIEKAGRDGIQVSVPGELYGFSGEDAWYVGNDTELIALRKTTSRHLGPFLEQVLKEKRSHTLTVQDRDVPLFYERVLQKILPCANLQIKDVDLETYRPQELKASFSFDSSRPGEITMKPVISYGDFSFQPIEDEKVPRTICRDVPGEFRISQAITRYFKYRDETGETLIIRDNDEAMYRLLREGMEEFMSLGEVYISENAEKIRLLPPPKVEVGVRLSGDWLELEVSAGNMTQAELQKILSEYEPKKPYYRLKSGEFLQLDEHGLVTVARLVDGLAVSKTKLLGGTVKIPVYRALYLDSILKEGSGITFYRDNLFKAVVRGMKSVEDSDFQVPASLQNVLREYQKTGFRWLRTLDSYGFGGILADDMGLGKTVQVIALLQDEALKNRESSTLIVCPASLVYNWENELHRFAPQLFVKTITGTASEREKIVKEDKTAQVLITSYDLLKRDIGWYEDRSFRFQILDEAQYIKNPATQSARAVKQIQSQTRFALTGTPIENRLSELWSIFEFLMPGFLFSYQTFKKQFELPIVREGAAEPLKNLKRLTAPFILRRLKQDVLKDLPEKLETVIYSKQEAAQNQLYQAEAIRLKQQLEESEGSLDGSGKLQILAQMMRLRQICCDPSLCFGNYRGGSAKLETCMELIADAVEGGHKILLFSQFTSMLDILARRLKKEGIPFHMLTGATSKEDRIRLTGEFQTDQVPVFLISLKAGGTGLNLTAADVVIHYDPWWNLAAQNQATDRSHRIGQEKQVTVFKLIMKHTIEDNILNLQSRKQHLAEQIISEGTVSLANLKKEDLLELLS